MRLRRLREERSVTQSDWARAAGVHQSQVARWEKDSGEPGIDSLRGMARHLGITLAALVGDEAPAFAPPRAPTPEEMALAVLKALLPSGDRRDLIEYVLEHEDVKCGYHLGVMKRLAGNPTPVPGSGDGEPELA
jgi:transcriptional regulator with XRE-family HTH domain